MRLRDRWIVGLLVAGLLLAACRAAEEPEPDQQGPATVEAIEGTDQVRVILTQEAADRLEIRTATVSGAGTGLVIPYAAVFYGPTGTSWTYTETEPLTFVRASITIDDIRGDRVALLEGPPVGTAVVTQGAAELFGSETGVDG